MASKKVGDSLERERNRAECAKLLRVIAQPVRLMILEALAERSQCVRDLNALVPIAQARLSQHMAALRKVELVDCHTNGPLRCYYVLRPTLVKGLVRLLCERHQLRRRTRDSVLREIQRTTSTKRKRPTTASR